MSVSEAQFAAARIARPTTQLEVVRAFYEHVVGLPLIGAFADHDGFNGVIFGLPERRFQLELVSTPHGVAPQPGAEDALVLYASAAEWGALTDRLRDNGTTEVSPDAPDLNPYWPRNDALVFVDPDGYRLIVASAPE
jgi:hypothetical protein